MWPSPSTPAARFRSTHPTTGPWPLPAPSPTFSPHDRARRRRRAFPEAAIAALKTLRLGERVMLSGRMGEIAGSGLFDLSRLLGKSAAEHRQFLQTPRFVARIEALTASKQK